MKWSYNPHIKHIFGFRPLRSVRLLLELRDLNEYIFFLLSFLCRLRHFQLNVILHNDCTFIEKKLLHLYLSLNCQNLSNKFASQINILIFYQQFFLLSSTILDDLLSDQSIFNLYGNFLRRCQLIHPQSNYFLLNLKKL